MGENYRDYFDLLIFDAQKPHFMYDELEADFITYKNKQVCQIDDLKDDDKIVMRGDMKLLNKMLNEKYKDFRGIIFEDNFYCGFENKHKCQNLQQWDYAIIFKELGETEEEFNCSNPLFYKKKWGSQLVSKNSKGLLQCTYFVHFINEFAQYSFSSTKSENFLNFMSIN